MGGGPGSSPILRFGPEPSRAGPGLAHRRGERIRHQNAENSTPSRAGRASCETTCRVSTTFFNV
jgi:hypothetical protein